MFSKFLQNSLKNIKNIRDALFNLKFQAKRSTTLLKRDPGICAFAEVLRTPDKILVLMRKFWEKKHKYGKQ